MRCEGNKTKCKLLWKIRRALVRTQMEMLMKNVNDHPSYNDHKIYNTGLTIEIKVIKAGIRSGCCNPSYWEAGV